jgi:large conductance mechanosensitive channel
MFREFKTFISRGNVIDLAVGIIIGAAFTGIVSSLVADIMMPIMGMLTGGLDFSNHFIALNGSDYASLKAAKDAGAPVVAYGAFINQIINFLIVSFAIFLLVKQVNKLKKAEETNSSTPPAPTPTETLLAEIRDVLKAK